MRSKKKKLKGKKEEKIKIYIPFNEKIAIFCFFLSGFVSLIYEICWIRKSSLVFGSTIYATSSVISVFFGGLALGSFLAGKYIHRIKKPLFIYGIIEILVGVFALLSPLLFFLFDSLFSQIYASILSSFVLLSLTRLFFITLIILPSSILIGTTLPLFVHHFINKDSKIAFFIPLLYSINTLGAVFGSVLCGFFLLKHLGINQSIILGSVINFIIGVIILTLKFAENDSVSTEEEAIDNKDQLLNHSKEISIAILFFITGFTMLSYEILWTRYLTLILHNTIYTYVLTLSVILTGIFLGSLIVFFVRDKIKIPLRLFIWSQILTGLIVQTILLLPYSFWKDVLDTEKIFSQIWIVSILFLLPSIFAGISYPCVIRVVTHRFTIAGKRTGFMNSINTCGGIIGSLGMAFIILPFAGLQKSLYIVTFLSMCVGIMALLLFEKRKSIIPKIVFIGSTIFIWIVIPFSFKTKLPADFLATKGSLIDYKEGLNSTLAIVKSKEKIKTLEINRLWQGQEEATHQTMAAHIPMISHKNPEDILVLGIGIGQVAERFLYYPIKNLTCVDIEKELVPLIKKHFHSQWVDDKRVTLVVDDGRNYVKHANKKYDIISIEIGQVFRPGLASFYSEDFYKSVKKKLSKGGVACQFVPLSFFELEEYKSLINTFIQIFPESVLWFNSYEFIIVGYNGVKPVIDENRYNEVISIAKVHSDLDYFYWGGADYKLNTIKNFMGSIILGPKNLKKFTENASVYIDNKPELEFNVASNQTHSNEQLRNILNNLKKFAENPLHFLVNKNETISLERVAKIRELNLNNILASELFQMYVDNKSNDRLLMNAYKLNPENVTVLYSVADYYYKKKNYPESIKYFKKLAQIDTTDLKVHKLLAYIYQENNDLVNAIKYYNRTIKLKPDADVYNNLGTIYFSIGDIKKALQMFFEAINIEPKHEFALPNYHKTKKILEEK